MSISESVSGLKLVGGAKYVFNPTAKTIQFSSLEGYPASYVYCVFNNTRKQLLYQRDNSLLSGRISGNEIKYTVANAEGATVADQLSVYVFDSLSFMLEAERYLDIARRFPAELTPDNALGVATAKDKIFTQLETFDAANDWEILSASTLSGAGAFATGPASGMTVTGPLGGATAGSSRYINIASGVTVDQATILLVRDGKGGPAIFKTPVEARFKLTMSQRLAETIAIAGFFECDPVTGEIIRSNAITAVDTFLNIRALCAFRADGTTATQLNPIYRSAGTGAYTVGATSFIGFTTAATGSTPDFICNDECQISFERDRVDWTTRDNNSTTMVPTTIGRNDSIPNPSRTYRFGFIVLNNTGTAPASSTDVRIHELNLINNSRLDVSPRVTAPDVNKAFPVFHPQSLPTGSSLIGDVGLQYRASATGGASFANVLSPATPAVQVIKTGAGKLLPSTIVNNGTVYLWAKFWNSTSVTLGTTAASFEVPLPPGQGIDPCSCEGGQSFNSAIRMAITGGQGLTNNTPITANTAGGVINFI
jgi:hypothetical protein